MPRGLKPTSILGLYAALKRRSSTVVPAISGECLFGSVMVSGIPGGPLGFARSRLFDYAGACAKRASPCSAQDDKA
jgi:hypothetical protein